MVDHYRPACIIRHARKGNLWFFRECGLYALRNSFPLSLMSLVMFSPLALLASIVICFVVGFFWYSEMLFGKAWMKAVGLTKADVAKGPGISTWVVALITGIGMALALVLLRAISGVSDYKDFLHLALAFWSFFYLLPSLNHILFSQRSTKLWLIEAGYELVVLVLQSLAIWFL